MSYRKKKELVTSGKVKDYESFMESHLKWITASYCMLLQYQRHYA